MFSPQVSLSASRREGMRGAWLLSGTLSTRTRFTAEKWKVGSANSVAPFEHAMPEGTDASTLR